MAMNPIVALAWFRAEDYDRIREICTDEMIPTFAEFEAKMERAIPEFEARGVRLEKVIIDPDELIAFAKQTGASTIDTRVRTVFAANLLAKKHSREKGLN
jgi:hypothetical protein